MRSKADIKTEENRLNANIKKFGKDKEYVYKMYRYAKNSWAIGFYKITPLTQGGTSYEKNTKI